MGNKTDVSFERVQKFISARIYARATLLGLNEAEVDSVGRESLLDLGFFDSLSFLELLSEIENEFAIEIDLSEYDPAYFVTLNGLASIATESQTTLVNFEKNDTGIEIGEFRYESLTPEHRKWNDLAKLFRAMYSHLLEKDLKIPLAENGEKVWLSSIEHSIEKTNKVIGCLRNDRLVGYAHGTIKLLPVYLEGNAVGFFSGLYVEPEQRKNGIAEKLSEILEEWFKYRRVDSIELQVLTENELAITFLGSIGFKKELLQMRKKL